MKKVILCIPSLETGGAERFTVELARRLDPQKFDVTVAVTRYMSDSRFKKALIDNGVHVVDLSAKNFFAMLRRQLAFFRSEKPDIIHANTGAVLHVMLACTLCKIPGRIYTVHNEAKLLYNDHFFKKYAYKAAFSLFRFTPVAVCDAVRETLCRDMNLPAEKIYTVYNGVDTARFRPVQRSAEKVVRAVSVGSLYAVKNQSMTVRVIKSLHDEGLLMTLDLVGDGEDRAKLQTLIHELHAENYITLCGVLDDVAAELQKADLFISASKTEGLPLSVLEAMACGLPIIATAAGGCRDIVWDGENGFLTPIDDEHALKAAVKALAENKALREKFGAASRRLSEQWSIQSCVNGYEALYEKLSGKV